MTHDDAYKHCQDKGSVFASLKDSRRLDWALEFASKFMSEVVLLQYMYTWDKIPNPSPKPFSIFFFGGGLASRCS